MPRVKITDKATNTAKVVEMSDAELADMLDNPCVVKMDTKGVVRLVVHTEPQVAPTPKVTKKRGRPFGSKNKPKAED